MHGAHGLCVLSTPRGCELSNQFRKASSAPWRQAASVTGLPVTVGLRVHPALPPSAAAPELLTATEIGFANRAVVLLQPTRGNPEDRAQPQSFATARRMAIFDASIVLGSIGLQHAGPARRSVATPPPTSTFGLRTVLRGHARPPAEPTRRPARSRHAAISAVYIIDGKAAATCAAT